MANASKPNILFIMADDIGWFNEKVKKGYSIGDKTYKVHLDGFNLTPFLKGEVERSPRSGFMYWSDEGELLAIRVHDWKIAFEEQRHTGLAVWREPFSKMRTPKLFNLRSDPFERGDEGIFYDKWLADRFFAFVPAQLLVRQWLETFKEFPPRARAASWSIDQVMESLLPKS